MDWPTILNMIWLRFISVIIGLISVILIFLKYYMKFGIPDSMYVFAFIMAALSLISASVLSKNKKLLKS